jgi:hypothetical protein
VVFLSGRIERQTFRSVLEPDVFFGKYSRPLEGRAVQDLALATVTEFGVQWSCTSQGIFNLATLAVSAPLGFAKSLQGLQQIWRPVCVVFNVGIDLKRFVGFSATHFRRLPDGEGDMATL